MAVTITPINPGTGAGPARNQSYYAGAGRRKNRFNIATDNSYPTGGYALTPQQMGMGTQIDYLDIVNEAITIWGSFWNRATQKLQLYVLSTGAEVANAVNVSTFSCDVVVEGL